MSTPNPSSTQTTQAFIEAIGAQGGKPLYKLSYGNAREVLEDAQARPIGSYRRKLNKRFYWLVPPERRPSASIRRQASVGCCQS